MRKIAEKIGFMNAKRDTVCTKTGILGSPGSKNPVFRINLQEHRLRKGKSCLSRQIFAK
jgi:hypothetical protein